MEAFFDLSYTVVQGNAGICKTRILSSETVELCPKLRTLKISPRHIARQNVSSTKIGKGGRSEHDELAKIVGRTDGGMKISQFQ